MFAPEELLRRIPGVAGARIVWDASGAVDAVHATVRGGRPVEEVAADIVTVLAADAGLDVDPDCVRLATVDDEIPAEIAVLEEIEHEVRIRLAALRTSTADERSSVEVELVLSETESAVGYAETRGPLLLPETFAAAALDAIEKLCGGRVALQVLHLQRAATPGADVLSLTVQETDGRTTRVHAGAACAGGDWGRAAVYAALSALNRRVGRILAGPSRHYRIA